MKKLLAIIILSLCFTTLSQANDIRDFQIEGISLGDNAIDFFDKEKIEKKDPYKKRIIKGMIKLTDSKYDELVFSFLKKDKKMKTLQVQGLKRFDDIKKCKLEKAYIEKEFDEIFTNLEKKVYSKPHTVDPSKKSIIYGTNYIFKNTGLIHISCTDYKKFTNSRGIKTNYRDTLKVDIASDEYVNFLRNEAYK